ncbi:MAG: formate dehydrogenase, partial [Thermaceae bacterium]|nr:formate dehydrogenase [Thermaceae bacterium]
PGLTATEMLDAAAAGQLDLLWSVGGNFLETLPDPDQARLALSKVPLRVHQDILLSSQMFVEGQEVILLPATTRYEVPGGVSQTSTERRVIFSPEIPGPRIAEARPEFEALLGVAQRCRQSIAEKLSFPDTAAIRAEIAQVVPLYDGIQHLKSKGDAFQYGGPQICPGGVCSTPDGRANFKAVTLPTKTLPAGAFRLATRRGKQFNSMVHERKDPVSGATRDAVLISQADANRLGLHQGQNIWLRNQFGVLQGQVFIAEIKLGTLQIHWPEGNVLLDPKLRSPQAKVPAYKESYAFIEVKPYSLSSPVGEAG